VTAESGLREDELAVERHLETPARGRDQLEAGEERGPSLQEFVRQTDGLRDVVSGDAELDANRVL